MNYLDSFILGAIQGITEFLPISSSGHLVIFRDFLHFSWVNNLIFDVVLHLATLIALIFYFQKEVFKLFTGFFRGIIGLSTDKYYAKLSLWLILGTIPPLIVGALIDDFAESLRIPLVAGAMLLLVGIWFLIGEKFYKGEKRLKDINWKMALILGFFQALALIPGVSRSGIIIISAMGFKIIREKAAYYAFLLGIPILGVVTFKKIIDLTQIYLSLNDWLSLGVGFFSAFFFGILSIHFLLSFLKKHSLKIFGYYRIILGLFILILNLF